MWVKALIYFFALLIVGGITAGILVPFAWIAMGIIANYDLYLLSRKGTQLWDGGSVAANAMATVSVSSSRTSGVANTRLSALENARSQGIISDAEYAEKRQQLEQDAEREKKLAALEEMRRAGMLAPVDYEAKKRDIMFESHGAAAGSPA